QHLVPRLEPVQVLGNSRPELLGVLDRLLIDLLVFRHALDVRPLAEFGRRRKYPLLLQDAIDVGGLSCRRSLCHAIPSLGFRSSVLDSRRVAKNLEPETCFQSLSWLWILSLGLRQRPSPKP